MVGLKAFRIGLPQNLARRLWWPTGGVRTGGNAPPTVERRRCRALEGKVHTCGIVGVVREASHVYFAVHREDPRGQSDGEMKATPHPK
eukprot:scaffold175416_cov27-Tisochrysis_lutea.AAC.1